MDSVERQRKSVNAILEDLINYIWLNVPMEDTGDAAVFAELKYGRDS